MLYIFIIGVLILVDQLVKYIVRINMELYQSLPVWQDVFHITYINNYGAAFSILQGQKILLIGFTLIALSIFFIFILINRRKSDPYLLFSLSVICGGGIGNLIDRIRFGYVVDYLDFRIWPVFNFADIFVVCGCGVLLLYMLIIEPRKARENREDVHESE